MLDSNNLSIDEENILKEFFRRRKLFNDYIDQNSLKVFTCPGCGYPTLKERGNYEICKVCDWEDDNQDDAEADEIWGGPNGELSLTENRIIAGRVLETEKKAVPNEWLQLEKEEE